MTAEWMVTEERCGERGNSREVWPREERKADRCWLACVSKIWGNFEFFLLKFETRVKTQWINSRERDYFKFLTI